MQNNAIFLPSSLWKYLCVQAMCITCVLLCEPLHKWHPKSRAVSPPSSRRSRNRDIGLLHSPLCRGDCMDSPSLASTTRADPTRTLRKYTIAAAVLQTGHPGIRSFTFTQQLTSVLHIAAGTGTSDRFGYFRVFPLLGNRNLLARAAW